MAALAVTPTGCSPVPSLYAVEEHLAALTDTVELVAPDQEQQFLSEFQVALTTAAEKRDRVANFLAHLEAQQTFAAAEISRLQALKKHYAAVEERLEGYVTYVIQSLGKDAKGKYRKLEGKTTVMFLAGVPTSVDVFDHASVPLDYKRATFTLPALMWNEVLNALKPELRDKVLAASNATLSVEVEKRSVKKAIDDGETVPGAKLITDKTSLRRR